METKKEQTKDGTKLKVLDFDGLNFEANGVKYFIEPHISAERFAMMQELEIELAFGIDYKKMFTAWQEQEAYLNGMQFVDASVQARGMLNGIADLESRRYPILQYCACFINSTDEDRRAYDEKIMNDKVENWLSEGIDYQSFFKLAVNMVRGLKENYNEYILSISQPKNETEEK